MLPASAFAHRLDEYLEATILSVDSSRVGGTMRLVPGVAVASTVIAGIDTNDDRTISGAEKMAYAQRVLKSVSLSVDGRLLPLHLVSASFPAIDEMKQGIGEIQIVFTANLPSGGGHRRLIFEDHHQSGIAVYLINCLAPEDKHIQIAGQSRNENQAYYQLDFVQGGAGTERTLLPSFSGFAGAFHLGLRHIADGTDHLLFLLALLLPAPLLVCGGRWDRRASVQRSLLQILRIVTAFTLSHSLTLALAAFGLVQLPSRPVEVLIAVSILVSAIHAIRPLFPGREAAIAAFFGLIHGLAFASALGDLGFSSWYRLVSLLGFNLGIEAMQLTVVAVTLPSLLLLSRTRAYVPLRVGGACFAAIAAIGWIVERSFNTENVIDPFVESVAHQSPWIATALLLLSLSCWPLRVSAKETSASA
jgi:hydrogenase/urease accessory protein HupE